MVVVDVIEDIDDDDVKNNDNDVKTEDDVVVMNFPIIQFPQCPTNLRTGKGKLFIFEENLDLVLFPISFGLSFRQPRFHLGQSVPSRSAFVHVVVAIFVVVVVVFVAEDVFEFGVF